MLANYKKLKNGVVQQIDRQAYAYDDNYIKTYISGRNITNDINYLRYGHICGVIGYEPVSILDIGYGDGGFLKVASQKIKNCYGSDISGFPVPEKCEFIKFEDTFNKWIEVITFFDCLEHFDDISFVKDLNCSYVVISLPNCHYFSDEWFENWKHRKPNEHLWHFNADSLTNFMEENGYITLNISDVEDMLRVSNQTYSNILTGIFQKI